MSRALLLYRLGEALKKRCAELGQEFDRTWCLSVTDLRSRYKLLPPTLNIKELEELIESIPTCNPEDWLQKPEPEPILTDEEMVQMRLDGWTLREIAKIAQTCHQTVKNRCDRLQPEPAEEDFEAATCSNLNIRAS